MEPRNDASGARPRLSIGLPVYNAQAYLVPAIESLLGQTYHDFELIISDNASTDATEAICREYAARDPRVRYYRQPENRGANWNFNEVFRLARGELFKWAAYDDLCEPTLVKKCVAVLDAQPGVMGVQAMTVEIGPDGRRIDPGDAPHNPAGDASLATGDRADLRFRDVLLSHGWANRSYGVFRAEAIRRTGLYRPIFGWEKVLMAEVALQGKFHLVPERLFFQRVHDAALSRQVLTGPRQVLQSHYDGRRLPYLAYIRGYTAAAKRSALGWPSRMLCLLWIAAYTLQLRKLGGIVAAKLPRFWAEEQQNPGIAVEVRA